MVQDWSLDWPAHWLGRWGLNHVVDAMVRVALLLSALLCSPAFALIEPPARYDYPYRGGTVVMEQPDLYAIDRVCASIGVSGSTPGPTILGCAKVRGGKCRVVIPNRKFLATRPLVKAVGLERFRSILIRHERAHCNGWGNTHPGGIEVTP